MKTGYYILILLCIALSSCRENDINLFDKTADERVAAAIAALKADLIAPTNGWRVKYRPDPSAGSFYVLMKFKDDNHVTIKTDLSVNDGEFYEQTLTYRIDSSLGLQLIFENYSFFSYLFELDDASFGAEYEYIYVNKTSSGELVFKSKTDLSNPTQLVFEKASSTDEDLLGQTSSTNLLTLSKDLKESRPFVPLTYLKISYNAKNLSFYVSIDEVKRIINFNAAVKNTDTLTYQDINQTSTYILEGESIVFDSPLKGTFMGNVVDLKSISLKTIIPGTLNICSDAIATHAIDGITSDSDNVKLSTSLVDARGRAFPSFSTIYSGNLENIFKKGKRVSTDIIKDIEGALEMELFYNADLTRFGKSANFYGVGFYIVNKDSSEVVVVKEFTPTLTANNLIFNFQPDYTLIMIKGKNLDTPRTDADLAKIDIYLNQLTAGDHTYVYDLSDQLYEFYNPCTGWSFIFF